MVGCHGAKFASGSTPLGPRRFSGSAPWALAKCLGSTPLGPRPLVQRELGEKGVRSCGQVGGPLSPVNWAGAGPPGSHPTPHFPTKEGGWVGFTTTSTCRLTRAGGSGSQVLVVVMVGGWC